MSKKKITASIFVMMVLLLIFILPARCSSFVFISQHEVGGVNAEIGSTPIMIPATDSRYCTSIYRKEFWIDERVLQYKIDFIFGPIWKTYYEPQIAVSYGEYSQSDVHQVIIHNQ